MSRWLAVLAILAAGCGGSQRRAPISSTGGAFASQTMQNLQETGAVDPSNNPKSAASPAKMAGAPVVVELTVDLANREDMKRLVPYLVDPDTWQIVGVISHEDTRRTWRFLQIGTDETRIDPFGKDRKGERRIELKDLAPSPGTPPGQQDQGNPLQDPKP